jgi:hypothetical protein
MSQTKHFLFLCTTLLTSTALQAIPPSFKTPVELVAPYNHHIQNFGFNNWNNADPNWLVMLDHGAGMSYSSTSFYLYSYAGEFDGARFPPTQYEFGLERILNHGANYQPAKIFFSSTSLSATPIGARYDPTYSDTKGQSLIDPTQKAGFEFPTNTASMTNAINYLKNYGCAIPGTTYTTITPASTQQYVNERFMTDWASGNEVSYVANFQSKAVVKDLVEKTKLAILNKFHDHLFLDDIVRDHPNCANANYGGLGSYPTWKDGQLDYIQQITNFTRSPTMLGRLGKPMKVFGNMWTPRATHQSWAPYSYTAQNTAKWYSTGALRLDLYYFESGGSAIEDVAGLGVGTGVIPAGQPEAGSPAYVNPDGGYIPANRVAVAGSYDFSKVRVNGVINKTLYLAEQFKAASIAAKQGSWFGWYGAAQVDLPIKTGSFSLVHINAMMLLRAIPNWENMAAVPLASRVYDAMSGSYYSQNSIFNQSIVQAWNPVNNELYAVFRNTNGKIDLKGGTIATATFVDRSFNPTIENAMPCFRIVSGKASLTCAAKIGKGIRIKFL